MADTYKFFEYEITRKRISVDKPARIESPRAAVETMEDILDVDKEQLFAVVVDGRNGMIGYEKIYQGTATGTSVRIADLFRLAVNIGGVGLVVLHNHPSGDPEPSEQDIQLTSEIIKAARILDIEFLDHLVYGGASDQKFYSIRQHNGEMWTQDSDEGMLSSINAILAGKESN